MDFRACMTTFENIVMRFVEIEVRLKTGIYGAT